MKSKRICRGQIWHWNDPLYGAKANASETPDPGESCIRYSRYVLVMQTENKEQSVLVIPMSSKYVSTTDYRIPIAKEKYETFSYARIDRMFPVYPDQLDEYICTIPDEYMKLIEAETIRLLCPTVYANIEVARLLIEQELPLDRVSEDAWYDEENTNLNLYTIIGKFIKECVFTSVKDSVYANTLYDAYSAWCYKKGNEYIPPEKKKLFCDLFCIIMHLDKQADYENYLIKNIRIDNIDFKDSNTDLTTTKAKSIERIQKSASPLPVAKKDTDNRTKDSSKKNQWTEKKKRAFMSYAENHTVAEVASKYDISTNSVYKYKKAFQLITDEEESVNRDQEIMTQVKDTLSSVSNYIKEDVDMNDAYKYLKNDPTAKDANIGKKEFYRMISASVYYSLILFLGLTEDYSTKALISQAPETLIASNNYLTIANISLLIKNNQTPYQIRNDLRKDNAGISQLWLGHLSDQLSNRLPLSHTNIQSIVDMISSTYCEVAPPRS